MNLAGSVATFDTSHYVILSGLSPNTTYYYTVTSADINTNEDTSVEYSFTTLRNPEEQHDPLSSITMLYNDGDATGDPKVITDTKAVIAFNTDQPALCTIEYGTNSGSYTEVPISETSYNENHSMHLPGLIFSTPYYYRITCEDNLDTAISSSEYNFTTLQTQIDQHAPLSVISTPADANTEDSADITRGDTYAFVYWTTDQVANQSLGCSTTAGDYTGKTATDLTTYNKSHMLKLTSLAAQTKYYCQVTSVDDLSNSETSEEFEFTTLETQIDQHAPLSVISTPADANTEDSADITRGDTYAFVYWTTDQVANQSLGCSTTAGDYTGKTATDLTTYNKSHMLKLTSLAAQTKYYCQVTSVDDLSNSETSEEFEFTTSAQLQTAGEWGAEQAAGDTTEPDISGVGAGTLTGESATIAWDTNEEAASYVRYGIDNTYGNMAGNDLVNADKANYATAHSVVINGLIPSTKYYYTVISIDAAGNIAESSENNFTAKAASGITSVNAISKSLGTAVITWTTGKNMSSIVEYGLTTSYTEKKENSSKTKEHEISLSNLQSGQIYHYRVSGKDADGVLYSSTDNKFQPMSPPQISNIKIYAVSENSAKISFSTNVPTDALITYTDVKDEKNSGSQGKPELASTHEVELSNLAQGTAYALKIKVKDEQGNETEDATKNFTTGKDENPPKIEQIRTDSALAQGDKVQTIIYWVTDEPAIASLIYKEGKSGQEKETKINDNPSSSHVAVITVFKPGTVYYFKAKAVDQSGNESLSGEYALLTPRRKENIIQVITNNFQDIFSWAKF